MSITRKAFEKGNFSAKIEANDRKNHPLYKFLAKNYKRGYTAKELAKAIKLTDSGVRSMLKFLRKEGYVKYNSPYFIIALTSPKKKRK